MTPQSRHRLKLKHEAVNAFAVKKIIERDLIRAATQKSPGERRFSGQKRLLT
jgi:hypothetical protein